MAMYKRCTYCNSKYEYGSQCECDGNKKAKQRQQKLYDKYVRKSNVNKKYDDFYHSKQWEKMAIHMRGKHDGLCIRCLVEQGEPIPYNAVHHIVPIKDDFESRLVEDNLICLCEKCHKEIHSMIDRGQDTREYLMEVLREYEDKF